MKKETLTQVLNEITEREIPVGTDLWPMIRSRLESGVHRRQPQLVLRLAAISAAVLILVGLLVVLFKPQPISAQEILNRAAQAEAISGVYGYRGVVDAYYHDPAMRYWSFTRAKEWSNAEGNYRIENYWRGEVRGSDTMPLPAQIAENTLGSITIKQGDDIWDYNAHMTPPLRHETATPGVQAAFSIFDGKSDMQTLVKYLSSDYSNIEVIGEGDVLNRSCYVISMIPKTPNALLNGALNPARTLLWIDRETYMLMSTEQQDAQQNTMWKWSYTLLDLNPALDPALFSVDTIKTPASDESQPPTFVPPIAP